MCNTNNKYDTRWLVLFEMVLRAAPAVDCFYGLQHWTIRDVSSLFDLLQLTAMLLCKRTFTYNRLMKRQAEQPFVAQCNALA